MKKLHHLFLFTILTLSIFFSVYLLYQLWMTIQQSKIQIENKQKLIPKLVNALNQLKSINLNNRTTDKSQNEYNNQIQRYLRGISEGEKEGKIEGKRKIPKFYKRKPQQLQQNDDPFFQKEPTKLKFIPKFKQYIKNFQHYYQKNKIKKICILHCNWECRGRLKARLPLFSSQQVVYYQKLENLLNQKNQFEWIIIYAKPNQKQPLYKAVREISRQKTFKGITLIWQNQYHFKQSQSVILFQMLKKNGWYYQQMQSLHLRAAQGKIVFIFTQKQKQKSKKFKLLNQPPLNKIALMLQVILSENIPYLREFVIYHINLGISKIFLYDNSGVAGDGLATTYINKYGFNLNCIGYSEEQIIKEWEDIWETFKDYIVYIPYQPVDKRGQILYNQIDCFAEYITIFEDVTKYTFFTDVDQFIVKPDGRDIFQYLQSKSAEGCGCVKFTQQKFINRFCYKNKRVIQMDKFIEVNTTKWANKNVCQNKLFMSGPSPHKIFIKSKQVCFVPETQLKFNHYNMERSQILWMFNFTETAPTQIQSDTTFMKYQQLMEEACQGKCSQNFEIGCNISENRKLCPFDFKIEELPHNNKI